MTASCTQNDAKDEKDARASRKALGLVDPELSNRGGQNQQRNDKILGWLRLLAAKDEKRQSTSKHRKDHGLNEGRVFQVALQFAARPAAPRFSRGEAASDESSAFEKIEHFVFYLRGDGAGDRCC